MFRKNDGTVRNSVEDPENGKKVLFGIFIYSHIVENQEADFWAQHNNDHPVFENDNQPIGKIISLFDCFYFVFF